MKSFFKSLFNFVKNVAYDDEIPANDKKILIALFILIISPIDLIPDWIPFFGLLDDFVIICLIVDYFFEVLDARVILKHYPWGMKSFLWFRKSSKILSLFIPKRIKKKIWSYSGNIYEN